MLQHLRNAFKQHIKEIHSDEQAKLHISQTSTKRVTPRLSN